MTSFGIKISPVILGLPILSLLMSGGFQNSSWANSYYNLQTFRQQMPPKLIFTTSSFTLNTWTCSPVQTVQRLDGFGGPIPFGVTNVNLIGANITFFSDSGCTVPITGVTINPGSSSANFYSMYGATGSPAINASVSPTTPIFVQQSLASASSVASVNVSMSSSTQAGNFLFVGVESFQSPPARDVTSISDNLGNTYISAGKRATDSSGSIETEILYAKNVAAGTTTATVTLNGSATAVDVWFAEFSGVDRTSPLDGGAIASNLVPGLTIVAPTVNTTTPSSVVFSVAGASNSITGIHAGNPFTALTISGDFMDSAYDITSSTGSYGAVWDQNTSGGTACASTVAFKAAPAQAFLPATQTETVTPVNFTWIGGASCTQIWSSGNCWQGGAAPGGADTAHFDSFCTINCNAGLGGNTTVGSIWMHPGYSGTINQGGNPLSIANSFEQDGGTFAGGTAAITDTGTFTLTGGSFISTSGTLAATSGMTITGGTFNANNGNVTFGNLSGPIPITLNTGNAAFNNVTFTASTNAVTTITGTVVINGNLTLNNSTTGTQLNGGSLAVSGNVTASNGSGGSATVQLLGIQSLIGGASGLLPNVQIAGGTLTLSGTISVQGNWSYLSGTMIVSGSTVVFTAGQNHIITGSNTFNNLTMTLTGVSRTLTFQSATTQTVGGTLTLNGFSAVNHLKLRSTNTGTHWTLSAGTPLTSYLDVEDGVAAPSIFIGGTTGTSVNSGDNTGWSFP